MEAPHATDGASRAVGGGDRTRGTHLALSVCRQ